MNLKPHIKWAQQILGYLERKDFNQVAAGFSLTKKQATEFLEIRHTTWAAFRLRRSFTARAMNSLNIKRVRGCIGEETFAMLETELLEIISTSKGHVSHIDERLR